jgi:hypothetical protein
LERISTGKSSQAQVLACIYSNYRLRNFDYEEVAKILSNNNLNYFAGWVAGTCGITWESS